MILGVNHIGILVKDIESAAEKFSRLYGVEKPHIKFAESRNMKVAVIPFGGVSLELLEDLNEVCTLPPSSRGDKETKPGNRIHHYALSSTDIDYDIAELEKKGCVLIGEEPKVGLRGCRIQFYYDSATDFLVELTEV